MVDVQVPLRTQEGASIGSIPISPASLGEKIRPRLIHRALVYYGRNLRQGTASTKTRGELSYSNRKPWPQKGTGRARAGTRRSPLWRGGGVIFGPKPRDYSVRMNRKQRRLAARSSLLWKIKDGEVIAVEKIELHEPKTKKMVQLLKGLGIEGSCLIGMVEVPREVLLACRNIPGVKVVPIRQFNAYDIARHKYVLVTRDALEQYVGEGEEKQAELEGEKEKKLSQIPQVSEESQETG